MKKAHGKHSAGTRLTLKYHFTFCYKDSSLHGKSVYVPRIQDPNGISGLNMYISFLLYSIFALELEFWKCGMIIKLFECFVNYLIKSPHNNACYNCHLSMIPEYFFIVHAISVGYNVFQSYPLLSLHNFFFLLCREQGGGKQQAV